MTFNEFLIKHGYNLNSSPRIDKEGQTISVKLIKDQNADLSITLTLDYKLIDVTVEYTHNVSFELMKDLSSIDCWQQVNRPMDKWSKFATKHGYTLDNYCLYFVKFTKLVELADFVPYAKFNESRQKIDYTKKASNWIVLTITFDATGGIKHIEKIHTKHNQVSYRSDFGRDRFPTPITREELEDLCK